MNEAVRRGYTYEQLIERALPRVSGAVGAAPRERSILVGGKSTGTLRRAASAVQLPAPKDAQRTCMFCSAKDVELEFDGDGLRCRNAVECVGRGVDPRASAIASGPIQIAPGIGLPLEAALGRYVLLGKSGAGKTNADTVLVEEFLQSDVPTIVIDILGNMWGLRSSENGLAPGFSIPLLGGAHGDLPLHATQGAEVARAAASGRSVLIDLSQFSREEQQLFVHEFFPVLLSLAETAMHVLVEEADVFAPARLTTKAQGLSHTSTTSFARMARNEGIGWTFSTQRSQLLAHDIFGSSSVFLAMLSTGESTQGALVGEATTRIGKAVAKRIFSDLGSLRPGEAWLLADAAWLGDEGPAVPPHRFRFRRRSTFDSARPPTLGERRTPPDVKADVADLLAPFRSALHLDAKVSASAAIAFDANDNADEADEIVAELEERIAKLEADLALAGCSECRSGAARGPGRAKASPNADVDGTLDRTLLVALLNRLPEQSTPAEMLRAIAGCSQPGFLAAIERLRSREHVTVSRGRYGGIGLSSAGMRSLGIVNARRYRTKAAS